MIKPCPRYEPELSAYVDGEVSALLTAEIETHLRACEACQAAVLQLRTVSHTLRRWDAMETRYANSTGFKNRVLLEVGAEETVRRPRVWRAAAACLLVVAGAGAFAVLAPRMTRGDASSAEQIEKDLQDLRRLVAAGGSPQRPGPLAPSASAETGQDRVSPIPPTVRMPSADDPSPSPPPVDELFEQRGDRRIARAALGEHDEYNRERGALELEQRVRSFQDRQTASSDRPTSDRSTSPLAAFLGEIRVASANYPDFQQVQVWPIVLTNSRSDRPRPISCKEAIAQEVLSVSESGSKETVLAVNNDAKRTVLVLAGDVLAGGRQDRVAREDMLIGPGQRISIATYTSGRERRTSYRNFTACNGVAPSNVRALVAADRALLPHGLAQDQFDDAVSATGSALSTTLRQGSLDSIFFNSQLSTELDAYAKQFERRLDDASVVGFAVAAGSHLLGVEVFGDHATFLENRARVLRSHLMAALVPDRIEGEPPQRSAIALVLALAETSVFRGEAPSGTGSISVFRGLGESGAFGFGLLDGSRVVHAVLFTSVPSVVGAADRRSSRRPDETGSPIDTGGGATGTPAERGGQPSSESGTEAK